MKVRLVGLHEHYEATPEEEADFERGFRRRHIRNPNLNPKDRSIIIVADLQFIGGSDDCIGVAISELPEGAKIGDEFEIAFMPIERAG